MNRMRVHQDGMETVKRSTLDESGMLDRETVEKQVLVPKDDGNLISSVPSDVMTAVQGLHLPIFDIDVPHTLVPSQTPGHSHLYIHQYVEKYALQQVIAAMANAGIMGQGNLIQFQVQGMQLARVPKDLKFLDATPAPQAKRELKGWF